MAKFKGPLYIAAYHVTRNYGGPEEGGWWYDAGELKAWYIVARSEREHMSFVRSIEKDRPGLVRNSYGAALVKEKTLNEVKARAMREFGHLDDGRCLGSVLSTGRIVMRVIEGRKPEAFYPSERPHYE